MWLKLKLCLFVLVFLCLSVLLAQAEGYISISETQWNEALRINNLQRIELLAWQKSYETLEINIKTLKNDFLKELKTLNQELTMAMEESNVLLIIIKGLKESYALAQFWNNTWPWIVAGTAVIFFAGGLWVGLQF